MRGIITNNKYIKKEKESGKLKMCNAWTINLAEIKNRKIESVVYITEKFTYTIKYEKAVAAGFLKEFGGETKLVVPLKFWDIIVKGV